MISCICNAFGISKRMKKSTDHTPYTKSTIGALLAIPLLASCAQTIIDAPITEEMRIHGKALSEAPIPENKALMEFTTNVAIPVELRQHQEGIACSSGNKNWVGRATAAKAYDPEKPINEEELTGNFRWLQGTGTGKFKPHLIAPERTFFYVDAGVESVFRSLALLGDGNGIYSRTRSCGPLFFGFTPKAGSRYRYTFVGEGKFCRSLLQEIGDLGDHPQASYTTWTCDQNKRKAPPMVHKLEALPE